MSAGNQDLPRCPNDEPKRGISMVETDVFRFFRIASRRVDEKRKRGIEVGSLQQGEMIFVYGESMNQQTMTAGIQGFMNLSDGEP